MSEYNPSCDQSWCHATAFKSPKELECIFSPEPGKIPSRNRVARWHAGSPCHPVAINGKGHLCAGAVFICVWLTPACWSWTAMKWQSPSQRYKKPLMYVHMLQFLNEMPETDMYKSSMHTRVQLSSLNLNSITITIHQAKRSRPGALHVFLSFRTFCKVYLPFTTRVRQLYWLELVLGRNTAARWCKKTRR